MLPNLQETLKPWLCHGNNLLIFLVGIYLYPYSNTAYKCARNWKNNLIGMIDCGTVSICSNFVGSSITIFHIGAIANLFFFWLIVRIIRFRLFFTRWLNTSANNEHQNRQVRVRFTLSHTSFFFLPALKLYRIWKNVVCRIGDCHQ